MHLCLWSWPSFSLHWYAFSSKFMTQVLMCPAPRWALQRDKQGVKSMAPVLCSSHEQGTKVTPLSTLGRKHDPTRFLWVEEGSCVCNGKEETEAQRAGRPWDDSRRVWGSAPGFLPPDFMVFPLCLYLNQASPQKLHRAVTVPHRLTMTWRAGSREKEINEGWREWRERQGGVGGSRSRKEASDSVPVLP